MMGSRNEAQATLFYDFCHDDHAPGDQLNETGIDRKTFCAHQALVHAALRCCFEDMAQNIALPETAISCQSVMEPSNISVSINRSQFGNILIDLVD